MTDKALHPAEQLVMIMNRIYSGGLTTTSGGNLSIIDGNGDVWITPSGVDKGSLTAEDIIKVKPDGTINGIHKPSVELPFHKLIYQKRKDVKAILHAHPPALVALSIVRRKPSTKLLPSVYSVCGEVDIAEYGLPGSMELGYKVASVFERGNNAVLLENHGVIVVGDSIFNAFTVFETLDFNARIEIEAAKIGKPAELKQEILDSKEFRRTVSLSLNSGSGLTGEAGKIGRELCSFAHRAYAQKLFSSTQGIISARLDENSFLITPDNKDWMYVEENEILYINEESIKAGNIYSPSILLHKTVYDRHRNINSIITAQPPCVMAFAVTDTVFDSRIIPESYILLRDVKKLPFDASPSKAQTVADVISEESPAVILGNECVILAGKTMLQAFDRLEVAEYSARAIIDSKSLGEIVMIDEEKVNEIKKAFGL